MKHIDKVGSKTFNAVIAPFSLSTYGDGTDALQGVSSETISC